MHETATTRGTRGSGERHGLGLGAGARRVEDHRGEAAQLLWRQRIAEEVTAAHGDCLEALCPPRGGVERRRSRLVAFHCEHAPASCETKREGADAGEEIGERPVRAHTCLDRFRHRSLGGAAAWMNPPGGGKIEAWPSEISGVRR